MRPIKLSLSAFGPFTGTEVIEFDTLGDHPLFLINGPTGSGKTTILDGICFALYGKTTGDEREAAQMRCDAASPELLTRVELIFRLQATRWRIVREPEQQRPKGRGEGMTLHQPRAELYRCDADGKERVIVASKVTEARVAIEELTGLNVDQFRQVMILPQGEFRNLLLASSSDRERVFSHLFQTQIYQRIEQTLKDKAAAVRKKREASMNRQQGILSSATVEDEAQLSAELESQSALFVAASVDKEVTHTAWQQANSALHEANQLVDEFKRLDEAKNALSTLSEQSEEISLAQEKLQQARVAIRIVPEFEAQQAALKARSNAQAGVRETEKQQHDRHGLLEQAQQARQLLSSEEPEMVRGEQKRQELLAFSGRVKQFESAARELEKESNQLEKQTKALKDSESVEQHAKAKLVELRVEQQGLLVQLKALDGKRIECRQLDDVVQNYTRWQDAVKALGQNESDLASMHTRATQAATKCEHSERALTRMEVAWHLGQAALLAEELEENQPCPVCGSEHHPSLAHSEYDIPSESERQRVAQQLKQDSADLSELNASIAGIETDRVHLQQAGENTRTALGDRAEYSLEELIEVRDVGRSMLNALERDQLRLDALDASLQLAAESLNEAEVQLNFADEASRKSHTQHEVARSQMRMVEVELPEAYRVRGRLESDIISLEQALADFEERKGAAVIAVENSKLALQKAQTQVENALQQEKNALEMEKNALQAWQRQLADSGLKDETVFRQCRLKDAEISALETKIQQFNTQLDRAQGAMASLQQRLSDKTPPDLEAIQTLAGQAQLEFKEAEIIATNFDKRLSLLREVALNLEQAKNESQALEDEYAVIGTLADTASGKTGHRISLQRFVLGVLLDDVLLEASLRFKRMSKGRYSLYRQQEKSKGAGASGLELLVDDAYTGKQRPVATLSGGESFMAALALALGLSDVVQAYAGGIKLDMLFIDEGFGSLDPESLDLAVNTLIDLQSSGRMVGIISHVPELKERINVRLDVFADRAGSYTRTVLA